MKDYLLGLDVWEGSLDIDESLLLQEGVGFLVIRLNSIDGNTHKDENFERQWEQAEMFFRWPYFVYNPWERGVVNAEWLGDNLPPGACRVAVDVEVKRAGLTPAGYSVELRTFLAIVKRHWKPVIYTGAWFLPLVDPWPGDCDYWWARYPFLMYPAKSQEISWSSLRLLLGELAWDPCPAGSGVKVPGPVKVWQCSGDRFKLPGCCGRVVDLDLWPGDSESLRAWLGVDPAPVRWEYALTAWARQQPNPYTGPGPDGM
jgi:hypothetical protein